MQIGVLSPAPRVASSSRDLVTWVRDAEDLGFDSVGVRGRVVRDSLEPLVALSLVAAATRRVELVLLLTAPRLTRPGILARQLAGLERTARGRLTVAVGTDETGDPLASARTIEEHLDELPGRRTLVAAHPDIAARVLPLAGRGWAMAGGDTDDFTAGALAVRDAWAFAGRAGHPRCLAVVDAPAGGPASLDGVRDTLHRLERAGADDVLLDPHAHSLRDLAGLLRTPVPA